MTLSCFSQTHLERLINGEANTPFMIVQSLMDKQSPYAFVDFLGVLTFNYGDDINMFFQNMESFLKKGYWLCGYFSYEFGYFLDPVFTSLRKKNDIPLAWFGVCRHPLPVREERQTGQGRARIKNMAANISYQDYSNGILEIKKFLEEGQSYQVNYTFKNKFELQGSVLDFYILLKQIQSTPQGAVINTGEDIFLSFSPELFFKMKNGRIITKPMKGTAARGYSFSDDQNNKQWLSNSSKIRAENIMIVDLLRNDLGRISKKVWVPKLFEIEKYRTLYQMTSTIEAQLKDEVTFKEIFTSLFPCGSVTGAPKIRTMQIIERLETEPRGIYTGAIGYISPQREASFNVAIRTLHLKGGRGQIGVGGGIVYDSHALEEYREAILKSSFMVKQTPRFSLIETMLWERLVGYYLLDLHLQRLERSCDYFSVPLDTKKLSKELEILRRNLVKRDEQRWKVRVVISIDGNIEIENHVVNDMISPVKVKISNVKINPNNEFLYHKTTHRSLYDQELSAAREEGFFEVIFINDRGELTEGAISNIFIEKDNKLYTPPVESGLLPGVLRKYLLSKGETVEKVLYEKDIYEANKLYIGNSVRGLIEGGGITF